MNETLMNGIAALLLSKQHTVTAAESCTGGLIAAELTRLAGSSAWFGYGFVTYSEAAKQQLLGVNPDTIASCGVVSEAVACEMASGAQKNAQADFALAVTGIAGPSGGTPEQPVGTVCIALAAPEYLHAVTKHFYGNRDEIRMQTVRTALEMLYQALQAA